MFSLKWNNLHTWNSCSLVFPFLEYCCQNWFYSQIQSPFIGPNESGNNLASPTSVRQKCRTLTPSGKAGVSIQSFFLRRCASTPSSGLPANSSLKHDQFNCGIGAGWKGCVRGTIGCAGGAISCVGGTGSYTGGQVAWLEVVEVQAVLVANHLPWLLMVWFIMLMYLFLSILVFI